MLTIKYQVLIGGDVKCFINKRIWLSLLVEIICRTGEKNEKESYVGFINSCMYDVRL